MSYLRTKPTNWNKFIRNSPANPFIKFFYLTAELKAYNYLLNYAALPAHPSIVELGSGTGYITKEISSLLDSHKVTLVDSNKSMLNIAQKAFKHVPVQAAFIEADLFTYPFSETYDLVHSGGVLEHFEPCEQNRLIKIHSDLLTAGGYCIIFVPTPTLSYRIVRKIIEFLNLWIFTDEVPMKKAELIEMVENAGLKVLATTYFWKYHWLSEIGIIAQKAP